MPLPPLTPRGCTELCMQTCKALYAACSQADDLWQPQCTSLGWRDGSRCSPAFRVYSSRMTTRKMVRQHVLRLMPYLPLQAQLTFNRGASVKQLAAAEERLGLALPWQVRNAVSLAAWKA